MLYSPARFFYRRFLSKLPLAKQLARKVVAATPSRDQYRLIGLGKHLAGRNAASTVIHDDAEENFPAPIYWSTISDAALVGASNIVFRGRQAIHHDLYDFSESQLHEELTERFAMSADATRLTARFRLLSSRRLADAVACTDSSHFNYAHWLTETLPKIALIAADGSLHGIPLLVDRYAHASQNEAVALVCGNKNPVVPLGQDEVAVVRKLRVLSPVGYASMHKRFSGKPLSRRSEGVFSSFAIAALRNTLFDAIPDIDRYASTKLFVRRRAHARAMLNQDEIEALAVANGFIVIEPGSMPFAEQVRHFAGASVVMGVAGAAFASLMFCRPGTTVVLLTSKHKDNSNIYFPSIGSTVGVSVEWIAGRLATGEAGGLHDDFTIDLDQVKAALRRFA